MAKENQGAKATVFDLASHQISDDNIKKIIAKVVYDAGVVTSHQSTPAEAFVRIAYLKAPPSLVIVVDDGGKVVGVMSPHHVIEEAKKQRNNPDLETFEQVLVDIQKDPEEKKVSFQHEFNNNARYKIYQCPGEPPHSNGTSNWCQTHQCACSLMKP